MRGGGREEAHKKVSALLQAADALKAPVGDGAEAGRSKKPPLN